MQKLRQNLNDVDVFKDNLEKNQNSVDDNIVRLSS
jgi:hypothetical protein